MINPDPEIDPEDECEGFMDAVLENLNFELEFNGYAGVKEFLGDSHRSRTYARSTCTEPMEALTCLYHTTDIDGCVVELKTLNAIEFHVRHLTILKNNLFSLRRLQPMLHKHLDLVKYNSRQLKQFNHSVGCQLFYESKWECWIGFIPGSICNTEIDATNIKEQCLVYLQCIQKAFQKKLVDMGDKGIALQTLMKNDLNDVGRMFILPDDCTVILSALHDAIGECRVDKLFEIIIFSFRFGDKDSRGISLTDFKRDEVKKVTIHSAVNIHGDDLELLWSTSGLQNVVGSRGVLRSCLSFSDCANFQSNLDGREMDISGKLRRIVHHPEKMQFVQFYADLPHAKPNTRYNPVSGSIAGGLVFPQPTSNAFRKDAQRYISVLKSDFSLMQKSSCRLECVTELVDWNDQVIAEDIINVDRVFDMLKEEPLLVPFPTGMLDCVRETGMWITSQLTYLFEGYSCTGNVNATWKAFQLELAAEKLLWGSPLSSKCLIYSVNLGPGKLVPTRSITDYLGFLALERWTACMESEDSIPMVGMWTQSEKIGQKIKKSVGMHDVIESSAFVLGRKLISTLLQDLFDSSDSRAFMRFEDFKRELYIDKPTKVKVSGATTVKQLTQLLTVPRRTGTAMVYGSLCKLITANTKLKLETVLMDGFAELGLKYFPAIQAYDTHRHAILSWRLCAGVWRIIGAGEATGHSSKSLNVIFCLVKAELESRGLIYASKLKQVPVIFPWIAPCVRKLSKENLSEDDTVKVLAFISCIALLMNGWFVDYNEVHTFSKGLPITQHRLRDLEIQSKLKLSMYEKFYRLHVSIPHQIKSETKHVQTSEPTEVPTETMEQAPDIEVYDRDIDDDSVGKIQNVEYRAPTCLPINQKTKSNRIWTSKEVEILETVKQIRSNEPGMSVSSAFKIFKQKCIENEIPFRTAFAFKCKFNRM